ncbi:uncharacterized protein LOC121780660 [Salvia splendens]|uniref:uncharacterized protein LOC121780660 n=1 Tax=Salvia splendens TaxID=180675 RepID=UPI001C27876A|nr:uncharacterized protein LOC121780660 [Salvia splendens]
MEELLEDRRSTAMSTGNPSSPSTLRFLGFSTPPESDPLELHESDVVWSFSVSVSPDATPPPPPQHHQIHHHRRHNFNPASSGLSAALSDDHRHLIRRKSTVMLAPASRKEEIPNPPSRLHQSAPMNVPQWPKELRRRCGNADFDGIDEAEDDGDDEEEQEEEIVPPHVIVARSHVTFSVFEGAGRTLKGRDLRRVRNAVFQETGFID